MTDIELEALFRQWWAEAGYTAPPGPHALMTHLGWARWLLQQQDQRQREVER